MVPFSQERGYAPKHPDVLAANPKGQVPVLVDGDLSLFDSTVILEYLEDAYPDPPLYPAAPKARAECRMLELLADEVLLVDLKRLMYRSEPPAADPERRAGQEADGRLGEANLRRRWAELERALDGRDWFGASFSAADIALFMAVAVRPAAARAEPRPSMRRWRRGLRGWLTDPRSCRPSARSPQRTSTCRRRWRNGRQTEAFLIGLSG